MSPLAPEPLLATRPSRVDNEQSVAAAGYRSSSPLRIGHVLRKCDPGEWGGTETAVERLCRGLQEHGVSSVIYCPRLETSLTNEPLADTGCEIRRFRTVVPVWGISRERRQQWIRVGGNLLSFELMTSLWREPGLQLIHSHTLGRLGGIAFTLARARHLPFVVTIHGGVLDLPAALKVEFEHSATRGVEWGKLFGFFLRARRLLQDADAIVTCNPTEAALLRRKYPSRRTVIQPHGIPVELYRTNHQEMARATFPQIEGRAVLLCVGRIDPVKNQGWLLEQFPEVLRRHPQAMLVLAGPCTEPTYGESLHRRSQELGIGEHVLFTGGLTPNGPQLLGLFQEARVLLLPSVSETFGLVIVEAWAAGIPVIASCTSGACALVKPGHNGWLFDLNAPAEFHQSIDEVLQNSGLAARFVANARTIVEEHDQSAVAARMKVLYERLIEDKQTLRGAARR